MHRVPAPLPGASESRLAGTCSIGSPVLQRWACKLRELLSPSACSAISAVKNRSAYRLANELAAPKSKAGLRRLNPLPSPALPSPILLLLLLLLSFFPLSVPSQVTHFGSSVNPRLLALWRTVPTQCFGSSTELLVETRAPQAPPRSAISQVTHFGSSVNPMLLASRRSVPRACFQRSRPSAEALG